MQTSLSYRTNRDLFSNYYLDEHLPETEAWDELGEEELREAKEDILALWDQERGTAPQRNESQLEEKFVRPMFRKLGIPFEVEESTSRTQRRPDYGFFESEEAARSAFDRREGDGDFYENAVAVADAKRWGRSLDTRGSGEHDRDFENPSYQIHVYLQETPVRWAVLTDGEKWRLYYGPTSHRLDSYYEVDLPTVLEKGNLEDFKYFYLFFRHGAFLEDAGGDCFLDTVYEESNVFAQELGADLQDNIYEAIKVLAEGFLRYPNNDLDEETLSEEKGLLDDDADFEQARLDLIHDSALIYLYRLIFVLYAESEGRNLLETDNRIYEEEFSLNSLKQDVAEELDSSSSKYRDWQNDLWERVDELFELVDQGSEARNIPEDELHVPAYDGGLFRTNPEEDDRSEAQFLADYEVDDAYLARVIDLVTRSRNGSDGGKIFVDYSSLDVRHLGSIYEGLLEYKLNVADEPLALSDGEYVSAGEDAEVVVEEGEVFLSTGSGERKATGSYYTPEYVVEYIVENTLGPLVEDIREELVGYDSYTDGGFAEEFAQRVFELKVLDPAMGSGHFLTSAVDYLAREIIDAQERQAAQQGVETVNEDHDVNWARRQVAQRCIYGVDLNPLAVELAKVSLWLRTLAAEQPLAFLDHHLKTGNSLVGSDVEDVLDNGETDGEDGQLTLRQSFDRTRQEALEHATEQFQNLLAIDNETLADIKEMEEVYEQAREDPLYRRLVAMANVDTAECSGLDVPDDAYERMAEALRDDSWDDVEDQDWFETAQAMADEEHFFHWELQFPVVFYEDDGRRKEEAGFDAVMGNPPYFNVETTRGTTFNDYLRQEYSGIFSGKADILYFFIDKGAQLFREGGSMSFITSRYFTEAFNAKDFRERISNETDIEQIVDFGNNQVFPGVDTLTIIIRLSTGESIEETDVVQISDELDSAATSIGLALERIQRGEAVEGASEYTIPTDTLGRERWLLLPRSVRDIKQKMREGTERLGDFCRTGQGMMTGLNEAFTVSSDEIEEWSIETEVLKPLVKNGDVRPFLYRGNDRKLVYLENKDIADYPATKEYLEQYRDELTARAKAGDIKWYRYQNPINKGLFDDLDQKVICPFIATDNRFYLDKKGLYNDGGDIELVHQEDTRLEDSALVALCNSSLLEFYHLNHAKLKRDGFYEYFGNSSRDLPIATTPRSLSSEAVRKVESSTSIKVEDSHESLSVLSTEMHELKEKRHSLNDSLLDHLGNYTDGPALPDVGLFQPTSDATVLDATADEYENLRIGDVETGRNDSTVTISATARYKPDDEDEHETDQWGYTETDYFEAFTLANLPEEEATLVEAFVPAAVEEADGFADFRETATKTNSLVDRLKAITLPDPDDVADDLRRFVEVRDRAAELDEKIERTDELIDEIVYDLYGLSDEEIEVVESAVAGD